MSKFIDFFDDFKLIKLQFFMLIFIKLLSNTLHLNAQRNSSLQIPNVLWFLERNSDILTEMIKRLNRKERKLKT